MSNMYAMNLARYKYCPDIKEKGLSGLPRLILFTSAEVKKKKIIFDMRYRFSENEHVMEEGLFVWGLPRVRFVSV